MSHIKDLCTYETHFNNISAAGITLMSFNLIPNCDYGIVIETRKQTVVINIAASNQISLYSPTEEIPLVRGEKNTVQKLNCIINEVKSCLIFLKNKVDLKHCLYSCLRADVIFPFSK